MGEHSMLTCTCVMPEHVLGTKGCCLGPEPVTDDLIELRESLASAQREVAELRRGIVEQDDDVFMPRKLYEEMIAADNRLSAENAALRERLEKLWERNDIQLVDPNCGPEPSLRSIVEHYYWSHDIPLGRAKKYAADLIVALTTTAQGEMK